MLSLSKGKHRKNFPALNKQNFLQHFKCLDTSKSSMPLKTRWYSKWIPVLWEIHDGDTRDLAYPPPQILVTCSHNVTLVLIGAKDRGVKEDNMEKIIAGKQGTNLCDTLNKAVISIGPLVEAGKSLETWILDYLQCHPILPSKFLQFSQNTVCDVWNACTNRSLSNMTHLLTIHLVPQNYGCSLHSHSMHFNDSSLCSNEHKDLSTSKEVQ